MTSHCLSVLLLTVLCITFHAKASMIMFNASETSIKPLISSNLTLTCSLKDTTAVVGPAVGRRRRHVGDDGWKRDIDMNSDLNTLDLPKDTPTLRSLTQTADNMAFVTSILISRNGQDIATVTEHFPARVVGGGSGFTVSGHLPGRNGLKGELQLTWVHPTYEEAANYVCDVDTLNGLGRSFLFSETIEVTEDDVSVKDLVNHVHQMQLDKEKVQAKIISQEHAIGVLNSTIENMQKSESALKQSLDDLTKIARVEPNIFFSAVLTSSKTISTGQSIVFNKIIINEGGDYSGSTGKFTCSQDGFYHFEVHIYTTSQTSYFDLRHNGQRLVMTANVDRAQTESSNSATVKLSKGDVVDVAAYDGSRYVFGDTTYLLTTFSGELIALA